MTYLVTLNGMAKDRRYQFLVTSAGFQPTAAFIFESYPESRVTKVELLDAMDTRITHPNLHPEISRHFDLLTPAKSR